MRNDRRHRRFTSWLVSYESIVSGGMHRNSASGYAPRWLVGARSGGGHRWGVPGQVRRDADPDGISEPLSGKASPAGSPGVRDHGASAKGAAGHPGGVPAERHPRRAARTPARAGTGADLVVPATRAGTRADAAVRPTRAGCSLQALATDQPNNGMTYRAKNQRMATTMMTTAPHLMAAVPTGSPPCLGGPDGELTLSPRADIVAKGSFPVLG